MYQLELMDLYKLLNFEKSEVEIEKIIYETIIQKELLITKQAQAIEILSEALQIIKFQCRSKEYRDYQFEKVIYALKATNFFQSNLNLTKETMTCLISQYSELASTIYKYQVLDGLKPNDISSVTYTIVPMLSSELQAKWIIEAVSNTKVDELCNYLLIANKEVLKTIKHQNTSLCLTNHEDLQNKYIHQIPLSTALGLILGDTENEDIRKQLLKLLYKDHDLISAKHFYAALINNQQNTHMVSSDERSFKKYMAIIAETGSYEFNNPLLNKLSLDVSQDDITPLFEKNISNELSTIYNLIEFRKNELMGATDSDLENIANSLQQIYNENVVKLNAAEINSYEDFLDRVASNGTFEESITKALSEVLETDDEFIDVISDVKSYYADLIKIYNYEAALSTLRVIFKSKQQFNDPSFENKYQYLGKYLVDPEQMLQKLLQTFLCVDWWYNKEVNIEEEFHLRVNTVIKSLISSGNAYLNTELTINNIANIYQEKKNYISCIDGIIKQMIETCTRDQTLSIKFEQEPSIESQMQMIANEASSAYEIEIYDMVEHENIQSLIKLYFQEYSYRDENFLLRNQIKGFIYRKVIELINTDESMLIVESIYNLVFENIAKNSELDETLNDIELKKSRLLVHMSRHKLPDLENISELDMATVIANNLDNFSPENVYSQLVQINSIIPDEEFSILNHLNAYNELSSCYPNINLTDLITYIVNNYPLNTESHDKIIALLNLNTNLLGIIHSLDFVNHNFVCGKEFIDLLLKKLSQGVLNDDYVHIRQLIKILYNNQAIDYLLANIDLDIISNPKILFEIIKYYDNDLLEKFIGSLIARDEILTNLGYTQIPHELLYYAVKARLVNLASDIVDKMMQAGNRIKLIGTKRVMDCIMDCIKVYELNAIALKIIKANPNILNVLDFTTNYTPFMEIYKSNAEEIAEYCLEFNLIVNTNIIDNLGNSLMHHAVKHFPLKFLKYIYNINPHLLNIKNLAHHTPLDVAIAKNHRAINFLMLKHAPTGLCCSIFMHRCIEYGVKIQDVAKVILDNDFHTKLSLSNRITLNLIAKCVDKQEFDTFIFIIKNACDFKINKHFIKAVSNSFATKDIGCINAFISFIVDHEPIALRTCLLRSISNDDRDLFLWLLRYIKDSNLTDKLTKELLSRMLLQGIYEGREYYVENVIKLINRLRIPKISFIELSPICLSLRLCQNKIVSTLIKNGFSCKEKDNNNDTPLKLANRYQFRDFIQVITEKLHKSNKRITEETSESQSECKKLRV